MSNRNAMLAKIAWGRKQMRYMDEDEPWRNMLAQVTGERRASKMSDKQLARVIDHMARCGVVFTSAKSKSTGKPYKFKAAQRRSDFYEIPDGPYARQKRLICAMWNKLGYDMTSLDTRIKRQCGLESFHFCNDPDYLQTLGRDLEKRLYRKQKKEDGAVE